MPKIIGDSLADHRELTRNRLFDALASLLAEQPFDSISMSQIASRAKVGRTAVYNHFPDKEVLLLEFMRRVTVQFSQKLQEALDQVDDPLAQLHDHATIISTRLLEILARCMETGAIPRQNPHVLIPLIHSCLAGNRLPANPQTREATIRTVQAFILRGIGADVEVPSSGERPGSAPAVQEASTAAAPEGDARDNSYMRCPVSA